MGTRECIIRIQRMVEGHPDNRPISVRMARVAGCGESGCHMPWISSTSEVRLVTPITVRWHRGVIVVDVARGALQVGVRAE